MDTYKTSWVSLLRFWFVEEKKQKRWSTGQIFVYSNEKRERPEIAPKSLILFSSSSVFRADCDWGIEPPKRFSFKKEWKEKPLPRDLYSSSYILSTSLISFPQILAVWFTFLFTLFDFLTSVYPFCLYSLHQLIFQAVLFLYFLKTIRLCQSLNLYKSLGGIVDKSLVLIKQVRPHFQLNRIVAFRRLLFVPIVSQTLSLCNTICTVHLHGSSTELAQLESTTGFPPIATSVW